MLFGKECRKIFHSLTYIIYCIIVILMLTTQYFSDCAEKEYRPVRGEYDYGETIIEDHDLVMSNATDALTTEFLSNRYVCYPFGFYKAVQLNDKKKAKIEKYIFEITGLDSDGIAEKKNNSMLYNFTDGTHNYSEYEIDGMPISDTVTYERFKEIMSDIDDILGGGSDYAVDSLVFRFSRVPMTYEQAIEEYDEMMENDRISGAYARLFSDYAGFVLAIIPVFVAAALSAADRRHRTSELIYSRKTSSICIIFTRFAAFVTTMFIPVLICMTAAFLQILSLYGTKDMDMTTMFTLPSFWLIPNIMTVSAVGMFLTELFSGGTAILVQFIWWFMSMMTAGAAGLIGKIEKFTFVCRHNSLYYRNEFIGNWENFVFNRIFYIAVSLTAVVLTVFVYEFKRGGIFNGIRLFGKDSIFRHKA